MTQILGCVYTCQLLGHSWGVRISWLCAAPSSMSSRSWCLTNSWQAVYALVRVISASNAARLFSGATDLEIVLRDNTIHTNLCLLGKASQIEVIILTFALWQELHAVRRRAVDGGGVTIWTVDSQAIWGIHSGADLIFLAIIIRVKALLRKTSGDRWGYKSFIAIYIVVPS